MRICFVTHASNYHSKKWAGWFVSRGHEVHVISFAYEDIPGATVHSLASKVKTNDSDLKKLGYLAQAGRLRKLIREILYRDIKERLERGEYERERVDQAP